MSRGQLMTAANLCREAVQCRLFSVYLHSKDISVEFSSFFSISNLKHKMKSPAGCHVWIDVIPPQLYLLVLLLIFTNQ